jgi:2-keto-3-deoxy-galactonokinase
MLHKFKVVTAFLGTFIVGMLIGIAILENHQRIVEGGSAVIVQSDDIVGQYRQPNSNTVFRLLLPEHQKLANIGRKVVEHHAIANPHNSITKKIERETRQQSLKNHLSH